MENESPESSTQMGKSPDGDKRSGEAAAVRDKILIARDYHGGEYFYDKSKSFDDNMQLFFGDRGLIMNIYLNYSLLSPYAPSKKLGTSVMKNIVNTCCTLWLEGGFVVDKDTELPQPLHFLYSFRKNDAFDVAQYVSQFREIVEETIHRYVSFAVTCHVTMPNFVNFEENMQLRTRLHDDDALLVSFFFLKRYICKLFCLEQIPTSFAAFNALKKKYDMEYVMMHHMPIVSMHEKVRYNVFFQYRDDDEGADSDFVTYIGHEEVSRGFTLRHHFNVIRSVKLLFYALKFRPKLRRWAYRAVERIALEKYSPAKLLAMVDEVENVPDPEEALQCLVNRW